MGEKIEEIIGYILAVVFLVAFIVVLPLAALFAGGVYAMFHIPDMIEWFKKQKNLTKGLLAFGVICISLLGVGIYNNVRYEGFDTRSYAQESYTVYKTYTGHCYHRASCGYLRSCIETTKSEALKEGLYPCSRCNP